ncbi:hypothetical protein MXD58_019090, partial [Frankia sp. AgKG'84/4]|nr:hypothetical protein [Frankia sp. AgKG'84/4]
MPEVSDRRSVLVVTGLAAVGVMTPNADAMSSDGPGELHEACAAALGAAIGAYESTELGATAAALVPLEQATRAVPRQHRLRGRVALDWMRLH